MKGSNVSIISTIIHMFLWMAANNEGTCDCESPRDNQHPDKT
jgi:hypothetical protein